MSDDFEDGEVSDEGDERPQRNQMVRRSFDGVATLMNNSATQALVAKATADINARWMIAMHRPRDLYDVRDAILRECQRPEFARAAIYQVPRGGSQIRGLSIRFAEAAMKAMGNMGAEAQTLYDSDEERVVRVTVTDYEGNTAWSRDLTIPKTKEVKSLKSGERAVSQRVNSSGKVVYKVEATDDDITTKESASISKASRTGILRLVPAWLLSEARAKCEKTQIDKAAKDPDGERKRMFDAFAELNAKPSWISDWLGHPADQATPSEVVDLQQLYRAIRDGHTSLDEALRARKSADKPEPTAGGVAAAMAPRERRGRAQPAPVASQTAPASETSQPVTEAEAAEIARDEAARARAEKEGR